MADHPGPSYAALVAAAALVGITAANAASPTPTVIGVDGTTMTLNGQPWLPRGVNISGFEATPSFFRTHYPYEVTALKNYGPAEFRAIRAFGADTLRIQVSQPSLDPQSKLFDATYALSVLAAIEAARDAGFAVVIMMQDEPISGEPHTQPLATDETVRDWDILNQVFGQDRGVMFELYNEPQLTDVDQANWTLWAKGGAIPGTHVPAVGMQTMIDRLRAEGARNVFVLDGLDLAQSLAGVPPISDPLARVVYAVHPYFNGCHRQGLWKSEFGDVSRRLPVFADEWSAPAHTRLGLGIAGQTPTCDPPPPQPLPTYREAVDLLNDLRVLHIPLAAGAFDVAGFMVKDVPGWTPSNYDNYSPSAPVPIIKNDDAGLLVEKLFKTDYQAPLVYADGVTH